MNRTLFRSRSERMIGGVAGGLAEYFGQDPTVVRIIIILLAVVTSGTALVAYLVMWVIVPEAPMNEGAEPGPSYLEQWTGARDRAPVRPPVPGSPIEPSPVAPSIPPLTAPVAGPGSRSRREREGRGGLWFGVILIGVGAFMLAERFVPGIDLLSIWPLIIIAIGLTMIFGRKGE